MKLAEILKKNYYIYKIGRKFRIFLFVLKDVLLLAKYRTRKDNTENGVIIPPLGYIKLTLNESVDYEKKILFDKSEELNWLHSIKTLLNEDSKVAFYYPDGLLIPVFLSKNISCKILIISKKDDLSLSKLIKDNDLKNISLVSNYTTLDRMDLIFLPKSDNLNFNKNSENIIYFGDSSKNQYSSNTFTLYRNINGRFFPKDTYIDKSLDVDFYLLTRKKRQGGGTLSFNDKNKISGATYLRSPEIYPFDLCYDSVLDHVDEFIFAVDNVLQRDTRQEHDKRDILIERFMDGLSDKNRSKVKLVKFDFKARFNSQLNVPAKWLVDVSNHVLDVSKYNNICFLQADEMYHEDNFEEIKAFSRQDEIIALQHEFLHFVKDLKHIRNPVTVAYTHAIRVFKKDNFSCTGDGYTFVPLQGKNHLPKIKTSKLPIYHLGYVIDFIKKMQVHLDEGGIFNFKDKKVLTDDWIDKADLIQYSGGYPKSLFLKNKLSSDKVSSFLSDLE